MPLYNRDREHRRPGPLRDLQELRIRGESLHHRVPVLRQPAAQARTEDRSRRPGRREAPPAPSARAVAAAAARAARSPASVPSRARTRRSCSWLPGSPARCCGATSSPSSARSAVVGKPGAHWWRLVTAPFVYNNTGYAFVCVGRDRPLRLAARAPARPGAGGRAVHPRRRRGYRGHRGPADLPGRARRQRRGAGHDRGLGDARPARPAGRARGRGRHHRRGRVRRGDRADAARRRQASWISAGVGVLSGVLVGLPLAALSTLSLAHDDRARRARRRGGRSPARAPHPARSGGTRGQQAARGHRVAEPASAGARRHGSSKVVKLSA